MGDREAVWGCILWLGLLGGASRFDYGFLVVKLD